MLDRDFNAVPGPDAPMWERVEYVRQRTISELEIFADDVGAESVQSLPSNVWTAALRHCCAMIFKPSFGGGDCFKIDARDHALILELSRVYIDLCDRYNKVAQITGLATYLGVSSRYLYNLSKYDNGNKYTIDTSNDLSIINRYDKDKNNYINDFNNGIVSNKDYLSKCNDGVNETYEHMNNYSYVSPIKEIKEAKERQLQGLLIDGKGQLVGVIAILNHEFGYAQAPAEEPKVITTAAERQKALSEKYRVSALPDKLSDN